MNNVQHFVVTKPFYVFRFLLFCLFKLGISTTLCFGTKSVLNFGDMFCVKAAACLSLGTQSKKTCKKLRGLTFFWLTVRNKVKIKNHKRCRCRPAIIVIVFRITQVNSFIFGKAYFSSQDPKHLFGHRRNSE